MMADRTARTDCPAFEELAVAWHEAGHVVGAVLVNPGLAIETVTIEPGEGYLGRYTFEDWRENVIPDEDDEDSGETCEHERQYLRALDIVSALGAVAEGMLLHGRANQPVMAGTGVDQANVHANAEAVLEDDVFRKAGFYHGPGGLDIDAALALIQRHPHVWRAVGLVAGALLREKTLDGFEVEALVRQTMDGEEPPTGKF